MSASTVARWNAIALERENNEQTAMKRPRDDEDDDDDISLISRSPSPQLDAMAVDQYDPYVRTPTPEPITVHTKIKPSNKGFAMLAKLGWTDGQPLGLSGDGRTEPIPFQVKRDLTGLGKLTQDVKMIETTVSQRRNLDSERQRMETEEQRRLREDTVARKTALQTEISSTLRSFYCALCEKQFQNVAQYDEHTNGYAHHHKARFKEMQASQRAAVPKEEVDKRKEKERKREEKELRKIAAAAGIKMPKPAAPAPAPTLDVEMQTGSSINSWAPATIPPVEPQGGFKKSGWATVGAQSFMPPPPASPPPPSPPASLPPTPPPPGIPSQVSSSKASTAPLFRTAGWTSLETGSLNISPLGNSAAPPPPPLESPPAPAPAPPSTRLKWDATALPPPPPPASSVPPIPLLTAYPPPPVAAPVRSGWQQFKAGPRRR